MSDTPLGRFCWYELMTTDPGGVPDFYGPVTGWTTEPAEDMESPYTMWMNDGTPIGGVTGLPEEAARERVRPHWLVYVSTPDLTDTKAEAMELGAQVLHEMKIPSVGDLAIIRDPQGAVFSAYEPAGETPGHDGPPAIGEFSWNELATEDPERAWAFYSRLFEWQKGDAMDMGEAGTYQMYHRGAHPLGGIYERPAEIPASAWLFYVRVPDVEKAVATLRDLGGELLNGPMEVPGGDTVAQCLDAQGAAFAVHATAQG